MHFWRAAAKAAKSFWEGLEAFSIFFCRLRACLQSGGSLAGVDGVGAGAAEWDGEGVALGTVLGPASPLWPAA